MSAPAHECDARIYRPVSGRIQVQIPFRLGNRDRLKGWMGGAGRPTWDGATARWLIARKHLDAVMEGIRSEGWCCTTWFDYERDTACAAACQNAKAETWRECVCGCEAVGHGGLGGYIVDHGAWVVIERESGRVQRHAEGLVAAR